MPWQERRDRLELLARAFEAPMELSPIVEPRTALVQAIKAARLEGSYSRIASPPTETGTRAGWTKVKDRSWYEREVWRLNRR